MKNYNDNRKAIQQMPVDQANLLLSVEYIMQCIKSGELPVEDGYKELIKVVEKSQITIS